jgi:hypothetical protein
MDLCCAERFLLEVKQAVRDERFGVSRSQMPILSSQLEAKWRDEISLVETEVGGGYPRAVVPQNQIRRLRIRNLGCPHWDCETENPDMETDQKGSNVSVTHI